MEDTKIFSQGMSKIHGWMGQKKKAIQQPSKPKRREKLYAYVMPMNPRTAPLIRHQISLRVRLSRDSRNQRRYSRLHAAMRMRGGPARRWLGWSDGTEEVLYIGWYTSRMYRIFSPKGGWSYIWFWKWASIFYFWRLQDSHALTCAFLANQSKRSQRNFCVQW